MHQSAIIPAYEFLPGRGLGLCKMLSVPPSTTRIAYFLQNESEFHPWNKPSDFQTDGIPIDPPLKHDPISVRHLVDTKHQTNNIRPQRSTHSNINGRFRSKVRWGGASRNHLEKRALDRWGIALQVRCIIDRNTGGRARGRVRQEG